MIYNSFKEYINRHQFDDNNSFNDLLDTLKNKSINFISDFFAAEPNFRKYNKRDMIVMATRVHYLCFSEYKARVPKWVTKDIYYSDEPIFPIGIDGMLRAILAVESPIVFKSHGVFVSANALRRV